MTQIQKGQMVLVRDFQDKPLIRKVWDVGERVVYICNEEQYNKLLRNDDDLTPAIGFPKYDVFFYAEGKENEIQSGDGFDWESMSRFAVI